MYDDLRPCLVCPACHHSLQWEITDGAEGQILVADARCESCGSTFPVRGGVAAFLAGDSKPEDLWEEANSSIVRLEDTAPEIVRRLLDPPMETMNPTDLFFRGLVLDHRGRFGEGKEARDRAIRGMYSPEQHACIQSQMRFVKEAIADRPDPVLDVASGMGALLEFLAVGSAHHFVATDLSPRVLLRDRAVLGDATERGRVSYLAFDARHMPFADRSVPTMVTYAGLANVANPAGLLEEIRRVLSGTLFAISLFYPEEPGPNDEALRRLGLESLLYRRRALEGFSRAGFEVRRENERRVRARPTPEGEILAGARIDGLPVAEAEVEWSTLVAT